MLNRRAFILGAGATAAAAAGGDVEGGPSRRRSGLHRLGLTDSPDHHVPAGGTRLVSGEIASAFMRRSVNWTMSVPDGPLSGVLYCLHGKGDDHRFAFDTIRLHDVAAQQRAPIAIA